MKAKKPVIVTTAHRGVFFGYVAPKEPLDVKTIRIEQARMCVYWSAELRGIVGLATSGPSKNCKVGPAATAITLNDVTAVMEVSEEAVAKWEAAPWA